MTALDIMRDLGIGVDSLGLLTSVYFLTFTAAQLPVGVRFGPLRTTAGPDAAPNVRRRGLCSVRKRSGFVGLLAGRALIGLETAGCLVAGLKTSAEWVPGESLARVIGLFITSGGLGALAATWPVGTGQVMPTTAARRKYSATV